MVYASNGSSIMKMCKDKAHELYEMIAENQFIWSTDRDTIGRYAWY